MKHLLFTVLLFFFSLLSQAYVTITVPIDAIYTTDGKKHKGSEMIFELHSDKSGDKLLILQANDNTGNQVFGSMIWGPTRCIHQTRDAIRLNNYVLETDLLERRLIYTITPKDNDGKIWRFSIIAIDNKPTYFEISEWDITKTDGEFIHFTKSGKRAIINYNNYQSIKPVLDALHKAQDMGIIWIEELEN